MDLDKWHRSSFIAFLFRLLIFETRSLNGILLLGIIIYKTSRFKRVQKCFFQEKNENILCALDGLSKNGAFARSMALLGESRVGMNHLLKLPIKSATKS